MMIKTQPDCKPALSDIRATLHRAQKSSILSSGKFFKTGPGDYAEHDSFIGVPVPALRKIAKTHAELSFSTLQKLIQSKINEERLLALIILINRYQKENKKREVIDRPNLGLKARNVAWSSLPIH